MEEPKQRKICQSFIQISFMILNGHFISWTVKETINPTLTVSLFKEKHFIEFSPFCEIAKSKNTSKFVKIRASSDGFWTVLIWREKCRNSKTLKFVKMQRFLTVLIWREKLQKFKNIKIQRAIQVLSSKSNSVQFSYLHFSLFCEKCISNQIGFNFVLLVKTDKNDKFIANF